MRLLFLTCISLCVDVKNVTNTFSNVAQSGRLNFMGNINIGKDVSLKELCNAYHAVVLVVFFRNLSLFENRNHCLASRRLMEQLRTVGWAFLVKTWEMLCQQENLSAGTMGPQKRQTLILTLTLKPQLLLATGMLPSTQPEFYLLLLTF